MDHDFEVLARRLSKRIPRIETETGRPRAAVALVLAPEPESILLIRRAERDGDVWSGHLAFPGGRAGPGDPDLRSTAMRETSEEVGIALPPERVLGQLDDLAPNSPRLPPILVRPFVFGLPNRLPFQLSNEVAAAFWVPLEDFAQPGVLRPIEQARHGTLVRMAGYHLPIGVVWGLTERILTPFLELTGQVKSA